MPTLIYLMGHNPADGQAQSAVAQVSVLPVPKHVPVSVVSLWIVGRERSFRCGGTSALQHLFPTKEE